ncbi:IclR family transcriptional regulator [Amycolatopsis balhimycina]|uniref:IclR family transcriptional regulator n=1 Tax=Amycolatopsis balhimycina TaxID=208443 RepID=UPI000687DF7F|nr:IclR family transcriptional regulator [Amycolatopsis balhimycina]
MAGGIPGDSFLARVVRVLEAFKAGEGALSVSTIARRTGLHVATASRIIAALVDCELLIRDADSQVRVGLRMWEIGLRASPTLALREAALPYMEDLHATVGQHVQLSVRYGAEVLFVERLSAPQAVPNRSHLAGRLPLHVSSSGQVLLAFGPASLQTEIMSQPLARYTERTITRPEVLRPRLAEIRERGFALCAGHLHPEAQSIAVPIRRSASSVVAASLSVVLPNGRSPVALVPVLASTAHRISRALSSTYASSQDADIEL